MYKFFINIVKLDSAWVIKTTRKLSSNLLGIIAYNTYTRGAPFNILQEGAEIRIFSKH